MPLQTLYLAFTSAHKFLLHFLSSDTDIPEGQIVKFASFFTATTALRT